MGRGNVLIRLIRRLLMRMVSVIRRGVGLPCLRLLLVMMVILGRLMVLVFLVAVSRRRWLLIRVVMLLVSGLRL